MSQSRDAKPVSPFHVVRLEGGKCLLEDDLEFQLNELYRLALRAFNNQDDDFSVLILQGGDSFGFSEKFLTELVSGKLRDQIRLRLYKIAFITRVIPFSSSKWIYACYGSCLSLQAEFAIACDQFIALKSQIYFGFPEINMGLYPCGGVFFRRFGRRNARGIDSWIKSPIKPVEDVGSLGPDVLLDSVNWQEAAKVFILRNPLNKKPKKGTDELLEFYHESVSILPETVVTFTAENHLEDVLSQGKLARDKCAAYRYLLDSAASYLVSGNFRRLAYKSFTWLQRSLASRPQACLYVDASNKILPKQLCLRLLEQKWDICIVSTDKRQLIEYLSRLYESLGEQAREVGRILWGSNLRWACIDPTSCGHYISLNDDGTLVLRLGGEEVELCLLSQNEGRDLVVAGPKIEVQAMSFSALGLRVLQITEPHKKKNFLTSWFLEELILYAKRAHWSLEELWGHLEDLGWRQWNNRSHWKIILQRRGDSLNLSTEKEVRQLNQEILALKDLEGVRSFLKGNNLGSQDQIPFRHFLGALCHVMSFVVSEKEGFEGLQDNALFVAASLGVPRQTELSAYSQFDGGLRQTYMLLMQNWPEFQDDFIRRFC